MAKLVIGVADLIDPAKESHIFNEKTGNLNQRYLKDRVREMIWKTTGDDEIYFEDPFGIKLSIWGNKE